MGNMATKDKGRTGRRPGESGSREAIADAARHSFAELGYDRTTIRGIAAEAGVDPALVAHFFGSKQKLFVSVMALPFNPEEVMPEILGGSRSQAGRRLAEFAVGLLENPEARSVLVGIVRAAASEHEAAHLVREVVASRIVGAVSAALSTPDAALRANLVASQMVGLIMARHVIRVEPIASLPPDALIKAIAPNLQRYLAGKLD
jgi:AcrR family transcriptional regulator